MPKSIQFVNLILAVVILLAIDSRGSAQNSLTAKANSVQPQPVGAAVESDRVRDGLAGPVRRVRTEVAKLLSASGGSPVEDKRELLEVAAYDIKGNKIANQYFPVAGSALTGKEVYKYDEKGNISEMTLLNGDGSMLSREVYKYDFDYVGNWTKMTTSVAVVEGGKVTFEPTEVTYRSIMYYLNENMLKMGQPASQSAVTVVNSSATSNTSVAVETRPQPVAPAESRSQPEASGAAGKPGENQQIVTNHKLAPTLPAPAGAAGRMNAVSVAEVKIESAGASAGTKPVVVLDAEAPPGPMPKPLPKPVSGGVLNGNAIRLPAPVYPDAARRMRIGGLVSVDVVLDETGKVISAQANSGPQILREAALQAALKAKFSPTKLSGHPVKITGVINYKFSLPQ